MPTNFKLDASLPANFDDLFIRLEFVKQLDVVNGHSSQIVALLGGGKRREIPWLLVCLVCLLHVELLDDLVDFGIAEGLGLLLQLLSLRLLH